MSAAIKSALNFWRAVIKSGENSFISSPSTRGCAASTACHRCAMSNPLEAGNKLVKTAIELTPQSAGTEIFIVAPGFFALKFTQKFSSTIKLLDLYPYPSSTACCVKASLSKIAPTDEAASMP